MVERIDVARPLLEHMEARARRLGSPQLVADALSCRAVIDSTAGRYAEIEAACRELEGEFARLTQVNVTAAPRSMLMSAEACSRPWSRARSGRPRASRRLPQLRRDPARPVDHRGARRDPDRDPTAPPTWSRCSPSLWTWSSRTRTSGSGHGTAERSPRASLDDRVTARELLEEEPPTPPGSAIVPPAPRRTRSSPCSTDATTAIARPSTTPGRSVCSRFGTRRRADPRRCDGVARCPAGRHRPASGRRPPPRSGSDRPANERA